LELASVTLKDVANAVLIEVYTLVIPVALPIVVAISLKSPITPFMFALDRLL
jgi:hypothetical protein